MARRTREEALATRERIIDAAIEVFYERGVARPSLTDVAQLAGVTRGAIYGHFANKADLFSAMCERVSLPTESLCDPASPSCHADPLEELRRSWLRQFDRATADPQWRKILEIIFHRCELVAESGLIQQRIHQGHQDAIARMTALLQRAVQKGQLPAELDVPAATHLLHGALIGVLQEWLLRPDAYDLAVRGGRYIDSLLGMIRLAPALRGTPA